MDKQTQKSIALAEKLLKTTTVTEKNPFSNRLKTIVEIPESKFFLIQMMDVAFRSKNYKKVADHIIYLLKHHQNYQALFTPMGKYFTKNIFCSW